MNAKIGTIKVGANQRHIMKMMLLLAPDDKKEAIKAYIAEQGLQDFVDGK